MPLEGRVRFLQLRLRIRFVTPVTHEGQAEGVGYQSTPLVFCPLPAVSNLWMPQREARRNALEELHDAYFVPLPRPLRLVDAESLERIATVGHVEDGVVQGVV